jgi:hypothetical protein
MASSLPTKTFRANFYPYCKVAVKLAVKLARYLERGLRQSLEFERETLL